MVRTIWLYTLVVLAASTVAEQRLTGLAFSKDGRSELPAKRAVDLTESGYLPRPRPRAVRGFDLAFGLTELGLGEVKAAQDGRVATGRLQVTDDEAMVVRVRLELLSTPMAARAKLCESTLLRSAALDEAVAVPRRDRASQTAPGPLGALRTEAPLRDVHGQPIAGEVAVAPVLSPQPWIAFVRDNCLASVSVPDATAIEGEARDRFCALVRGLDRLLMAAQSQELKDDWLPVVEAVMVELPSATVGRPFNLEARVSLHGQSCPEGRLQLAWRMVTTKGFAQVVKPMAAARSPEATGATFVVDEPGWWEVTCEASYDGSPAQSRKSLLYVSPSTERQ